MGTGQAGKRVGNLRPDPTLGSRFGARPDPTIFGPRPDPTRTRKTRKTLTIKNIFEFSKIFNFLIIWLEIIKINSLLANCFDFDVYLMAILLAGELLQLS